MRFGLGILLLRTCQGGAAFAQAQTPITSWKEKSWTLKTTTMTMPKTVVEQLYFVVASRWPGLLLGKRPDSSFSARLVSPFSSCPFNKVNKLDVEIN